MEIYQFNVRFQSQKLEIYFKHRKSSLNCKHFVSYVLKKIASKSKESLVDFEDLESYGLFENINGIEQMIDNDQDIFEMKNFQAHHIEEVTSQYIVVLSSQVIIRKKNLIESQLQLRPLSKSVLSKIHSFYSLRQSSAKKSWRYKQAEYEMKVLRKCQDNGKLYNNKYFTLKLKLDKRNDQSY